MNKQISTRQLSIGALIAAIYVVLCLAFAPVSYGAIQFRIAEALAIFAVFSGNVAFAVTVGCGIANLLGFMLGVNPLLQDVFFGTLATGIAGYMSWKLGGVRLKGYPILAVIPPVLINAVIIGGEITWLETGSIFKNPQLLTINMGYIGLSQLIPCLILGPALVMFLERTGIAGKYLTEDL